MFNPRFRYTPTIVNELSIIERLYGQILGERLIPSLSLKLLEENQILATHHSTSIEGNPLSPVDVTNIILNDRIPTTKSEKEVKNYFRILNSISVLAKKRAKITADLTKDLHKEMMEGVEKEALGKFRNGPVFVGHKTTKELVVKHNPPFHNASQIEKALVELYEWLQTEDDTHPLLKAGIFHHEFAYIHPFFDGNGRLARILTSYYILLKNYEVTKFFILDDFYDVDRSLYSDTLHTADKGEKTEWLEYFLEGIAYSLQSALGRINDLRKQNLEELEGEKRVLVTSREEEVLQTILDKKAVKTSDIQDVLQVTRQQAHALLSSLVKKKLLEKHGITKKSYYKLLSKKQQ